MKLPALVLVCWIVTPLVHAAESKLTFSTHDFWPFNEAEKDKQVGPLVDVINAVCKKIQFDCKYEGMSDQQSRQRLKDGAVNGSFPLAWTKEAGADLWFTIPLIKTAYAFFSKIDSPFTYKTLKDIEGKSVGVAGPSDTSQALEKIRDDMKAKGLRPIRITMYPKADGTGLRKVVAGETDLYYVNRDAGFYRVRQFNVKGVKYAGVQSEVYYFAAFAKKHNNKAVIGKFNEATLQLAKEGVLAKILSEHSAAPAKWDDKTLGQYNIVIGSR